MGRKAAILLTVGVMSGLLVAPTSGRADWSGRDSASQFRVDLPALATRTPTTMPRLSRPTTTRPRMTTTIPFRKLPTPPAPRIDPTSFMSYLTTGNFRILITDLVNPNVGNPLDYTELRIYRYMKNHSTNYPVVCGGNKWRVIGPPDYGGYPGWTTVSRTSGRSGQMSTTLALGQFFKPGDRFLITLRQWTFGNEFQRTTSSDVSAASCYENVVQIAWDTASRQFDSCVLSGFAGEYVKYVWDATGIGGLLRSAAFKSLRRSSPAVAKDVERLLNTAKNRNLGRFALVSKSVGSGAYEVYVVPTDGEKALAALDTSLKVAGVFGMSSPMLSFVTASAKFLAGSDAMADRVVGNCERIWTQLNR